MFNFIKKFVLLVSVVVLAFTSSTLPLHRVESAGASMYISPSSGSFAAGKTFSVNVMLSASQAANAISGNLSFDTSTLEVTGLSRSGSKVSVWVRDPSYSNSSGSISFEGIIPNPGYTGTGGKVLGITFRTKGSGSASVRFSSGKILANDGNGTNITSGLGSATYTVAQAGSEPAAAPGLPTAPKIQSESHTDSNAWYANNAPQFKWGIPTGTTAVSTLVNQTPNSDPGASAGVSSTLSLKDYKNGTSYLHVKFRNKQGWGPVAHFKFQIDNEKPTNIDIQPQDNGYSYLISAQDQFSGIDHYEWKDGEGQFAKVEQKDGYYEFAGIKPGLKDIVIKAVDRAGNSAENTFTIGVSEDAAAAVAPQHGFPFNYWWIIAILAILLLLLLIYWLWRHRRRFAGLGKGALAKSGRAGQTDNAPFLAIADEMLEQIKILEHAKAKRTLTDEETKLLKHIHSSLQKVEKLIKS